MSRNLHFVASKGRTKTMYKVETLSGTYLSTFANLGAAREFARVNKQTQIRNAKSGKLIPVN